MTSQQGPFVKGRPNKNPEANLMCYVRTRIADVSVHFPHDPNVLVTVQQRVLLIFHRAIPASVRCSVGFQAGVRKDDDEALSV